MSDWENEDLQVDENKEEKKENKNIFNEFDDESEVIPVEVKEKREQTIQKKENEVDYEKKYQERKKKDIAMMKEIEESVKNIKDEELRKKKMLELLDLKRAEKFIGEDNDQDVKDIKEEEVDLSFNLKTEKDYINLAQKSVVKINKASKSNKNAYDFIKNTIELLLPTLNEDHIQNITNAIKFLKNKVDKKDKNKKDKAEEKTVVPKSDRFEERKALYKQYGDGDISENKPAAEDDYNDDGDFM